jgi:hypothetical protein
MLPLFMRLRIPLSSTDLKKWIFIVVPGVFIISVALLRVTTGRATTGTDDKPQANSIACGTTNLSGQIILGEPTAYYDGDYVNVPTKLMAYDEAVNVLSSASPDEKWIEVDLSDQTLKAWDGTNLFLQTLVSTGYGPFKTPTGEFRIWIKLRATKMEGGSGSGYYYLPNVPYVMFFGNDQVPNYKGYGLHGTYWHNDFGTPRSHGCVNLPTNMAKDLYYWATPVLQEGKGVVYSDAGNVGTRIVIHE